MKQIRARLTQDEYNIIQDYREKYKGMVSEAEAVGLPPESINHGWYKGKHWSLHFKAGKDKSYFDIRDEIIAEMKAYAPVLPTINYPNQKDGHLLVISPADVHIGKLCSEFETGDKYSEKIACDRVLSGLEGIIQKAAGHNIEKILLIIGNDILHVDTPKSTTTSGTHQDTCIMWYDAFMVAKKLYTECIYRLLQIAPVTVQYNPSNHDYTTGFFLADSLCSWFSNSKNITFDVSPAHRKYYNYGINLIGSTHGDGAKETDLALLMAHEAAQYWAESKHRYFYTHHIHHKKSRDYMSVCVEALRSPSGTDSWHHRNGYQHAPKAIEGFIHHPEFGQIARLTHIF